MGGCAVFDRGPTVVLVQGLYQVFCNGHDFFTASFFAHANDLSPIQDGSLGRLSFLVPYREQDHGGPHGRLFSNLGYTKLGTFGTYRNRCRTKADH